MSAFSFKPHIYKFKNRDFAYLDLGPRDGTPTLFFHGFPGSSYQGLLAKDYLDYHKLRLISFDRPGYGLSHSAIDYEPEYFLDALTGFLNEKKFSVINLIGVSGGAPYAIKAAADWQDRVKNLVLLCGLNIMTPHRDKYLSEFQKHGLKMARIFPVWQFELLVNFALSKHQPFERLESFLQKIDPQDQMKLRSPKLRNIMHYGLEIAQRHGPSGIIYDGKNYAKDWNVSLENITAKTFIFHGDQDRILDFKMSAELSQHIPGSYLKIWPGENHYSLALRMNDILRIVLYESGRDANL